MFFFDKHINEMHMFELKYNSPGKSGGNGVIIEIIMDFELEIIAHYDKRTHVHHFPISPINGLYHGR